MEDAPKPLCISLHPGIMIFYISTMNLKGVSFVWSSSGKLSIIAPYSAKNHHIMY